MRYHIHFITVRYREGQTCFVDSDELLEPGEWNIEDVEREINRLHQEGWELLEHTNSSPGSNPCQTRELILRKLA